MKRKRTQQDINAELRASVRKHCSPELEKWLRWFRPAVWDPKARQLELFPQK